MIYIGKEWVTMMQPKQTTLLTGHEKSESQEMYLKAEQILKENKKLIVEFLLK